VKSETRWGAAIRIHGLVIVALIAMISSSVHAQVRVINYNIAQLRGNQAALASVLNEMSSDDHAGQAHPVSIMVFQEVTQDTFNALNSMLSPLYTAGTYTNTNEDSYGGAQAVFYRSDVVFEVPSGHDGTFTGAGRRARRWQFRLTGFSDPFVDFYVYSGHLKAGTGESNEEDRLFGAENIKENIEELSGDPHVIVCGDFNFYSNNESAYQAILNYGTDQILDPLGSGSWSGGGNASKHTQSPRVISDDGLASGGMDDRFDFQLHTTNLSGSRGLKMISGSMRAVGNDGNHYNDAINDGNNSYFPGETARSNSLANNLHNASDHIPVMVDYRIPASMTATMFNSGFGTIIAGGELELFVNVKNSCSPAYAGGGSDMAWYLSGEEGIQGVSGSGMLSPGEDEWTPFTIMPTGSGVVSGTLLVNSDDDFVQGSPAEIPITGTVLRHSDASFSAGSDTNFTVVSATLSANSGIQVIEIPVWNNGWDSGQASLDLDAVDGVDAPFQLAGTLENGVTSSPGTIEIEIDTTGLGAGQFSDAMQLLASDENLPGATDQTLSFSLVVTIEDSPVDCEGDIDGSGRTDVQDLLQVLDGFGSTYDIDDLLGVIADWDCGLG
tara:strand:- start:1989 stop:3821 length:1833 start_codon:yes stop_codon:yes gene_type:complete